MCFAEAVSVDQSASQGNKSDEWEERKGWAGMTRNQGTKKAQLGHMNTGMKKEDRVPNRNLVPGQIFIAEHFEVAGETRQGNSGLE
jgi:hypothetical protein